MISLDLQLHDSITFITETDWLEILWCSYIFLYPDVLLGVFLLLDFFGLDSVFEK